MIQISEDSIDKIKEKRMIYKSVYDMTDEEFSRFKEIIEKKAPTIMGNYLSISSRMTQYDADILNDIYAFIYDLLASHGFPADALKIKQTEKTIESKKEYSGFLKPQSEGFDRSVYNDKNWFLFDGTIFFKVISNPIVKHEYNQKGLSYYYVTYAIVSIRVPHGSETYFKGERGLLKISEHTTDTEEDEMHAAKVKKNYAYRVLKPLILLKSDQNFKTMPKNIEWECNITVKNLTEIGIDENDLF